MNDSLCVMPAKQTATDTAFLYGYVRFVCMAGTLGRHEQIAIPQGDVLLITGDFTTYGNPKEIVAFNKFLGTLPHQFKLVIGGANEIPLDPSWRIPRAANYRQMVKRKCSLRDDPLKYALENSLQEMKVNDARELLTNAVYIEDSEVCVSGIRVYGSPWQPYYTDWAFSASRRQQLKDKYNKIPKGIDVLLTYVPPLGFGDKTSAGAHIGSVELLNVVHSNVQPKYHVFGYPRGSYGCFTDGRTKFINACACDVSMNPKNVPIVFDVKIPE